jgi:hypothetical protein
MEGFLCRNPILRTKRARNIDSVRVNGATTRVIKDWFGRLNIPVISSIKPENRWNMDESGIMEGLGVNGLVVGSSQRRSIQKKQPGSRAWTSFIECVSASGKALLPLVIFKGKSVQQQWFPQDLSTYKEWLFTATDNAWTSDSTAIEWLEKIFLPQTSTLEPRLLINSRRPWESRNHRIYVFLLLEQCLPSILATTYLTRTLTSRSICLLVLKKSLPKGSRFFDSFDRF